MHLHPDMKLVHCNSDCMLNLYIEIWISQDIHKFIFQCYVLLNVSLSSVMINNTLGATRNKQNILRARNMQPHLFYATSYFYIFNDRNKTSSLISSYATKVFTPSVFCIPKKRTKQRLSPSVYYRLNVCKVHDKVFPAECRCNYSTAYLCIKCKV